METEEFNLKEYMTHALIWMLIGLLIGEVIIYVLFRWFL